MLPSLAILADLRAASAGKVDRKIKCACFLRRRLSSAAPASAWIIDCLAPKTFDCLSEINAKELREAGHVSPARPVALIPAPDGSKINAESF
jgi:hypothetical protein